MTNYPASRDACTEEFFIDGDYIIFQNNKYLVCDPTYINANVGMCMPEFKNVIPEIIQPQ